MLMIQNCRYVKPMPADMRGVKRMRRRGKEQTLISELIQGRFMIHSECNTPHPICVAWYSPPYWTVVHLSSFSGTWSNKRKLNTSKMHSLPYWRTKCSMIQTPASAVADHHFSVFSSIYQHGLSTVSDQAKTNSLLSISYSKLSLDGSVGICLDLQFEQ